MLEKQKPDYSKMSNTIYTKTHRDKNFTTVNNEFINNKNLSWADKGMLLYLLSKPEDWRVIISDLINSSIGGKDAVYSILQNLRAAKHLKLEKQLDDKGKVKKCIYHIFELPYEDPDPRPEKRKRKKSDEVEINESQEQEYQEEDFYPNKDYPLTDNPEVDAPDTDNPLLDKPELDNPLLLITEVTNTKITNELIINSEKKSPEIKNPFPEPIENKLINDLINIGYLNNKEKPVSEDEHKKRVINLVRNYPDKDKLFQVVESAKIFVTDEQYRAGYVGKNLKPDSGFKVQIEVPVETLEKIKNQEERFSDLSRLLNIKTSGSGQKSEILDVLTMKVINVNLGPIKYADQRILKLSDNQFIKPEVKERLKVDIIKDAENLVEDFEIFSKKVLEQYPVDELKDILTEIFGYNQKNIKSETTNETRAKIKDFMLKGTEQAVNRIISTIHKHYNPNLDIDKILLEREKYKPVKKLEIPAIPVAEKPNVNLGKNPFQSIGKLLQEIK